MNPLGKICPYCKTRLSAGDEVALCSVCEMPHHLECWKENRGCTTFGCTGTISAAFRLTDHPADRADFPGRGEGRGAAGTGPSAPGTVRCARCGLTFHESYRICMRCGTPVEAAGGAGRHDPAAVSAPGASPGDVLFCPRCAAQCDRGERFCYRCGSPLAALSETARDAGPPPRETAAPAGNREPSAPARDAVAPPAGTVRCPRCGACFDEGVRFCFRCGIPLAPDPVSQPDAGPIPPADTPREDTALPEPGPPAPVPSDIPAADAGPLEPRQPAQADRSPADTVPAEPDFPAPIPPGPSAAAAGPADGPPLPAGPEPAGEGKVCCLRCGILFSSRARFCYRCGGPVVPADGGAAARTGASEPRQRKVYCSQCGITYHGEARFCLRCGNPVSFLPPREEAAAHAGPGRPAAEPRQAGGPKPVCCFRCAMTQQGGRYCIRCGTDLEGSAPARPPDPAADIACRCGRTTPGSSIFCMWCGQRVPAEGPPPVP